MMSLLNGASFGAGGEVKMQRVKYCLCDVIPATATSTPTTDVNGEPVVGWEGKGN